MRLFELIGLLVLLVALYDLWLKVRYGGLIPVGQP